MSNMLADGVPHRLLDVAHQVVLKPFRSIYNEDCELVEFDADLEGLLGPRAHTLVLNTNKVRPWILGVHIRYNLIPVSLRVIGE